MYRKTLYEIHFNHLNDIYRILSSIINDSLSLNCSYQQCFGGNRGEKCYFRQRWPFSYGSRPVPTEGASASLFNWIVHNLLPSYTQRLPPKSLITIVNSHHHHHQIISNTNTKKTLVCVLLHKLSKHVLHSIIIVTWFEAHKKILFLTTHPFA